MLLHYAGGDKLSVPVSHLYLISRYSGGDPEHAPLHKLCSGQWEKARGKAMQQVRDTAAELLNIYARRAARVGHAFPLDTKDYARFVAGFEYTETDDQAAAIEAVLGDMMAGRPMDRLVCGDVGFGKTEVALRAAFVAVMAGKQVAILVPTTLLAEQHYQKFCDRFADWPIKIAELSRFRSAKEIKATLAGLATGQVDIVIGTHKLVQPDVHFHALGLVMIDEEHRFGVRHKEQFKALRAEVDMLTLTATPIPRTLGMALEGIRDFSVIATAPQKRLAVKTFVSQFNHATIREAVLREVKRGGQVFFLHNEVDTMQNIFERLSELLPNMRIAIAHGQMPERELEQVMRAFTQGRFHVLLCSTIIETGIDIPNANTIIINRADKFGLAQLHQLRGRVGRSHHQAYAYLLTPEEESLTSNAKKRLEAIQRMGDLGSGFFLAMHDLEIRGVGEVLGESQSGEMHEIGFGLYNDMLKHAVECLKNGVEPDLNTPLAIATEINLHAPTLLPEDYCPDVHERLVLYKRFANCNAQEALYDLQQELIDRFGLLPEAAQTLLYAHQLRLACHAIGIIKIDSHERSTSVQFMPKPPLDPLKTLLLIQKQKHYKLISAEKLRIEREAPLVTDRIQLIHTLLKELNSCKTAI
jgi:transcription-repair coupling factor (superfamily II helicase)